ncbi:sulfur carrier protein ThiS [Lipingzhangella sp. LS1_29]|uniref:Sulfur carrier protein ThiS n=1 Tax=Lipingzhangella rawalii TaxID=2055835 RepID=A0ABU2H085_9ACTN|nr:sulfur carrier protein ThiS [Lipingzhangella rawalii]MDS1268726.1 sulfur carrier protein ThiS [Lipingzhangella rawalii]
MEVAVNGETRTLPPGTTVATVVGELTTATSGVAVSLNDEVVPRTEWPRRVLRPGDRIDVLTAVQGG